jgi:hypothetical protein
MTRAIAFLAVATVLIASAAVAPAAPIPSEENVAIWMPTTGTVQKIDHPTSFGVDGDRTTWTAGDLIPDAYWRVDLMYPFDLGSVRVSTMVWGAKFINGAVLRVYGNDGVTEIGSPITMDNFIDPVLESAQTNSYNNGGAGWSGARYIDISNPGIPECMLRLGEVEVMADVPYRSLYPGYITGISASANSNTWNQVNETADVLVNNSGMSDATASLLGDPSATHTQINGDLYKTTGSIALQEYDPTITFDLGGTYDMTSMYVWNCGSQWQLYWGFKELNVLTSNDGVNYTPLADQNGAEAGNYTLPQATYVGGAQPYQLMIDLDGITASHVQIVGLSGYATDPASIWALAQVRFYGDWVDAPVNNPGDANGDQVVDDKDASVLGAHWLQSGVQWADGDFNLDNIVDDKDAAILAAHWGEGVGEAEVPEPGTLVLLAGIVVMGLIYWRRRKA